VPARQPGVIPFLICPVTVPVHPVLLLVLLVSHAAAATQPLSVGVSIPPQKYLVERVGGGQVTVTMMLQGGESPETYDPTLKRIRMLGDVRLYFRIGVPVEEKWLSSLERGEGGAKIVACCENIIGRVSITADSHVWTSPRNARLLAGLIKEELVAALPDHGRELEGNYHALLLDLEALDREIRARLTPRRTDYFVMAHAALDHYARDYGLIQLSLENAGREPGAKRLVELLKLVKQEDIRTLFLQKQHPSNAAAAFADEIDAEVVEIDLLDGDYIDNLRRITKRIAAATR